MRFFEVAATLLNLLEKCFGVEISIVAFRSENSSSASLKLKGTETEACFVMSRRQKLVPLRFVMMLCCDRNPAARGYGTTMLSHLSAEVWLRPSANFGVYGRVRPRVLRSDLVGQLAPPERQFNSEFLCEGGLHSRSCLPAPPRLIWKCGRLHVEPGDQPDVQSLQLSFHAMTQELELTARLPLATRPMRADECLRS